MARARRKARTTRISNLEPWEWRWARGESIAPLEEGVNPFSQFGPGTDAKAQAIWAAARETVIAEFAETKPGRMPGKWWLMDAPSLWASKGLGNVPVEFRGFEDHEPAAYSWYDISAKAQHPFLEKMGVAP